MGPCYLGQLLWPGDAMNQCNSSSNCIYLAVPAPEPEGLRYLELFPPCEFCLYGFPIALEICSHFYSIADDDFIQDTISRRHFFEKYHAKIPDQILKWFLERLLQIRYHAQTNTYIHILYVYIYARQ